MYNQDSIAHATLTYSYFSFSIDHSVQHTTHGGYTPIVTVSFMNVCLSLISVDYNNRHLSSYSTSWGVSHSLPYLTFSHWQYHSSYPHPIDTVLEYISSYPMSWGFLSLSYSHSHSTLLSFNPLPSRLTAVIEKLKLEHLNHVIADIEASWEHAVLSKVEEEWAWEMMKSYARAWRRWWE